MLDVSDDSFTDHLLNTRIANRFDAKRAPCLTVLSHSVPSPSDPIRSRRINGSDPSVASMPIIGWEPKPFPHLFWPLSFLAYLCQRVAVCSELRPMRITWANLYRSQSCPNGVISAIKLIMANCVRSICRAMGKTHPIFGHLGGKKTKSPL